LIEVIIIIDEHFVATENKKALSSAELLPLHHYMLSSGTHLIVVALRHPYHPFDACNTSPNHQVNSTDLSAIFWLTARIGLTLEVTEVTR